MEHGANNSCEGCVWWHGDPFLCPSYPDSPEAEGDESNAGNEERPAERSSVARACVGHRRDRIGDGC